MTALLFRMSHAGAAAGTTLVNAVTPTSASLVLTSAAGWPTGAGGRPFLAVLDPNTPSEEKILCSSITGNTVAVATGGRGFDDTVATSHVAGAVAEHVLGAIEVDDDNRHIYTPGDDDHTQYFRVDGARPVTGLATFDAGITDTGTLTQTGPSTFNGNTHITGTLQADGAATLGAGAHITGDLTVSGNQTVSGTTVHTDAISALAFAATGLTGATTPSRYAGGTAGGAPTSGTFLTGDYVVDTTGLLWVCTAGGTPGTWTVGGLTGNPCGQAQPGGQTDVPGTGVWTLITSLVPSFLKGGMTWTANAFKVPVTGIYRVTAQTLYQQSGLIVPAGRYVVGIYKNGTVVLQGEDSDSASPVYANPLITGLVSAAANDSIDMRGWAKSAGTASTVATENMPNLTFFSIDLVSR